MIRFIWRAPQPTDKTSRKTVLHVEHPDRRGTYAAICGTRMKLNRAINTPFDLDRPVCGNCLRSCLDERIAA